MVVTGDVDVVTAAALAACVEGVLIVRCRRVVVDLAGVRLLGAAGVSVLVRAAHRAGEAGGVLCVARPRPLVRKVLAITGTAAQLGVVDGDEDPLGRRPAHAAEWASLPLSTTTRSRRASPRTSA